MGNGGWTRWSWLGGDLHAYARFALVGGRLELVEQYLRRPDGRPLLARDRKAVQWGWMVMVCNKQDIRDHIVSRVNMPGPDLARAAAAFSTSYKQSEPDHWLKQMLHAQFINGPVEQAPWPGEREDVADPGHLVAPSAVLDVPASGPYGDDFYAQVAATYEALKGAGIAPNKAMAVANNVPKTSVDRWVRVAREGGHLPPAPRGNPVTRW